MTKAEAYIRDAWRAVNEARSNRGARMLDHHDKEMFMLGLTAAYVATTISAGSIEDVMAAIENIGQRRT